MEQQQDHYEYRLFRRTRQACANCRRKKIRCSGDRPICTYCARLRQKCAYGGALKSEGHGHDLTRPDVMSENRDESSALFSLESRMSSLEDTMQSLVHLLTNGQGTAPSSKDTSPSRKDGIAEDYKWLSATSDMTLSSAADVYFQYCHNQPYCLFHEQSFRQRLVSRGLPEYLCLALMATASRFSHSSRPLPHYADQAWELVMKRSTADLDSMESLAIAQTTHLLCVIDYSDGQCRAGWIKLGLAIRIAQCYRLNTEPDPRLRPEVQEECRRTFWSIYLLDKLMSCGRERHPGLQDRDCQLRVPCNEQAFRDYVENRGPTLDQLTGETSAVAALPEHSHFSIIILMASTLNRVVQYVLRGDSRLQADVPWAIASQYSALESTLWRLELDYGMTESLSVVWQQTLTSDGKVDPRVAGPLVYGRALFHLAGCLLHHPFLLQHRLAESASRTPPGFLSKAWMSSRSHATALTTLQETENLGSVTVSCFRGYCSMVAGSVHLLFASDSNKEISEVSVRRYEECRGLLMKLCRYWESSRRMFVMLERLYKDRTRYRQSLDCSQMSRSMGEKPKMAVFWGSVDNWVPSSRSPSPERGGGPVEQQQVQPIQFNTSMDFFELAPLEPWETGASFLDINFLSGAEFK